MRARALRWRRRPRHVILRVERHCCTEDGDRILGVSRRLARPLAQLIMLVHHKSQPVVGVGQGGVLINCQPERRLRSIVVALHVGHHAAVVVPQRSALRRGGLDLFRSRLLLSSAALRIARRQETQDGHGCARSAHGATLTRHTRACQPSIPPVFFCLFSAF